MYYDYLFVFNDIIGRLANINVLLKLKLFGPMQELQQFFRIRTICCGDMDTKFLEIWVPQGDVRI